MRKLFFILFLSMTGFVSVSQADDVEKVKDVKEAEATVAADEAVPEGIPVGIISRMRARRAAAAASSACATSLPCTQVTNCAPVANYQSACVTSCAPACVLSCAPVCVMPCAPACAPVVCLPVCPPVVICPAPRSCYPSGEAEEKLTNTATTKTDLLVAAL